MKIPARRRVGLLLTSLCPLLFVQAAGTQSTREFSLDDGLRVIMREDHRVSMVVSQLWCRIGSSYEAPGLTGLSHTLEHMIFKGNRKLSPGEASRVLHDLDMEESAFTTDDYTACYQVLARDCLPVILEMKADRITYLSLSADQFKNEIEVIREKRRLRTDDNPNALVFEHFKTVAYPASGYHTPTIGRMANLQRMTIDDLCHWCEPWYVPNNTTLVVVGDVTTDKVKTLVEYYFGEIPWRQLLPARKPLGLAKPGERRLKLCVRIRPPNLIMGLNVPSLDSSENPREINAPHLVDVLLDSGCNTRLTSYLERSEELAVGASTYYDAFNRGDNLFILSATPNVQKNKTLEQIEAGLWEQLNDFEQSPPSAAEIERVRVQIIVRMVCEKDSITTQASSINQLGSIGLSWKLVDQDPEALRAMAPDDIQKAAHTYFTPSRLALAQVLPVKAEEKEARHE